MASSFSFETKPLTHIEKPEAALLRAHQVCVGRPGNYDEFLRDTDADLTWLAFDPSVDDDTPAGIVSVNIDLKEGFTRGYGRLSLLAHALMFEGKEAAAIDARLLAAAELGVRGAGIDKIQVLEGASSDVRPVFLDAGYELIRPTNRMFRVLEKVLSPPTDAQSRVA